MSWVTVNGIRVLLEEGASIHDYNGLVTEATAQMLQFRESWGDDEVFAITRKGDLYTLRRMNGQDEVLMGPVERPPEPEDARRFLEIEPDLNICPAFHTYDGNGAFLGITICISGKWGSPYHFMPLNEGDIWPFAYGQWNTEEGATRPEDYEEQRFVGEVDNDDVFEIPAAHDYVAYNTAQWVVLSDTPGAYSVVYGVSEDGRQWKTVSANSTEHNIYDRTFSLIDDWDYWWNHFDEWKEVAPRLDVYWRSIWDRIAYQKNGYVLAPDHYAADDEGWVRVEIYEYSSTYINSGCSPVFPRGWTTAKRVNNEIMAGFLFGLQVLDQTHHTENMEDSPYISTVESNITIEDYIYAFGEVYPLKIPVTGESVSSTPSSILSQTYYHSDNGISDVNPRIYRTDTKDPVFLASFYRKDKQVWEYVMIGNDVEQHNDEDAMYDWLAADKHSLPITVGGEPVYGNGDFSLVSMDNPEFEIHLDQGEPEDLSTPIVEL